MKGAAEEANLTVVAIILIGIIVAVATPIINDMMTNASSRAACMNKGGCWVDGACDETCSGSRGADNQGKGDK